VIRKPPDFDLWLDITKSVKPLKHRSSRGHRSPANGPPAPEVRKHITRPSAPHVHVPSTHLKAPPQLTGFDRRTAQRFTRGNVDIEQRLDLHGTGIELARMRLLQFVRDAQAQGVRTVLVITGKGDSPYSRHTLHGADHFHSPERQGRLRRLLPEWLHEAEFRTFASGFQPAHPKHGGGGAYYVKIRRQRERG
jgi:DNA-nicking Smr family endonuclease